MISSSGEEQGERPWPWWSRWLAAPAMRKVLIGMVHVRALPGTPRARFGVDEICALAAQEARQLRDAGFDAVLIENMHDVPYLKRQVGPEICACMTAVCCAVRSAVDCPVGVQVLAGANKTALAVAQAGAAQFIRAEGFVFASVADEGVIESDAGELLRYRRAIGAEQVKVFTDIKKKHSSHAVTSDVTLEQTASAAQFFGAEGLIVTGCATASPASCADLEQAARGARLPILVGSGTTPELMEAQWPLAHGFIIGSYIKQEGVWERPLDAQRIAEIVRAAKRLCG